MRPPFPYPEYKHDFTGMHKDWKPTTGFKSATGFYEGAN